MTLDTDYEVVGLIGSLIVSVGLIPQVAKVYRTKSAIDFRFSSLGMNTLRLDRDIIYDHKKIVETPDDSGTRRHLVLKPCKTCDCTCGGGGAAAVPSTGNTSVNQAAVIGLIGSFIISAGLVPQVSKVYRTKSANDISYSFLAMYNIGLLLIVIYGIGEALWPIYIPCSLEFLGALVLLVMKLLYRNNPSDDVEEGKLVTDAPVTPSSARFRSALTPK